MSTGKGNKKPRSPRETENVRLVNKAIKTFEKKLEEKNVTVGEFVRLLELQKELAGEEPREIKVTWVEQGEIDPKSER